MHNELIIIHDGEPGFQTAKLGVNEVTYWNIEMKIRSNYGY